MPSFLYRLSGKIPSKKNSKMWVRGRSITDPEIQKRLAQITGLLKRSYLFPRPLTCCTVTMTLYVSKRSSDLDNALTSILDALADAGVIVNDNTKHTLRIGADAMLVRAGEEGAVITVTGEFAEEVKRNRTK